MGPKKGGRSSSTKKGASATASKKEQKKQVAPLTKETGVPTATFFGGKKTTPAAAVSAGDQAGSNTSASLVSVPPRQVRPKPMSAAEAATLIALSPSTSDVGVDSSQSGIQSTQGVTHLMSVQPQLQRQPQVQQGEAQVEPQLPTILVPPEVAAHLEIEIHAEVSAEQATSDDPLSFRSPARKRRASATSSSPLPSDDLDLDWHPQIQSEREACHEPTKLGKRKVPATHSVMGDEEEVEVVYSAADEEFDEPVITVVTPAPVGMQQTDIFTLSRNAARDVGGVALVPPPTTQVTTTPTRPTASIFSQGQQGPPSSSTSITSTSGAVSAQQSQILPLPSSTSSGIECGTTNTNRNLKSPVWDFFSISKKAENQVICSICKQVVSRGKLGTSYGTGGQRGHLQKHHSIQWEAHLSNIRKAKSTNPNVAIDIASDDEELIVQGGGEEARHIFSGTHSSPGSSTAVVAPTPSTPATSRWLSKRVVETPMQKSTSMSLTGLKKSGSSLHMKTVQTTITSIFWSEAPLERNHPTARLYNAMLAKMLALDLLPFSFVEGVGFLEFVTTVCPKWKVASWSYFARVAVPALHQDVLDVIGAALQKSAVHTIHLTTNMWTSCQAVDYMCITAHWVSFVGVREKIAAGVDIVKIFQATRKHATVALFPMEKSHTAVNILEEFNSKVVEWLQLRRRMIGYVSTDNGSNIVKAMADGGYFRVPCLAHIINIIVQDFLKKENTVRKLLTTCRRICTHFSHSFKARKQLRIIQRDRGLPVRGLIQEVATRWTSTFYMLERLFEQYLVINEYVFHTRGASMKDMRLEVEEWDLVKSLTDMLRPFEIFMRAVSKEDCHLGKAIPLLVMLEHNLKAVSSAFRVDAEKQDSYQLAESLLSRLVDNTRLKAIHSEQHYICATILDPRYKKALAGNALIPFSEADVSKYKHWLALSATQFEKDRQEIEGTTTRTTDAAGHPASRSTSVAEGSRFPSDPLGDWLIRLGFARSRVDAKATDGTQSGAPLEDIEWMVQAYLDDPTEVCFAENPLVYWYGKMSQWPLITKLAINYLACPLTNVSTERVFSAAGAIVTSKRTCLSAKNVGRLTMIRMNQHFILPDYKIRESTQEEEDTDLSDGSSSL
ncbi:zinc finger BED domain-containing protein 6-like isoform X1 [Lissotriton helveticus]